MDTTPADPRLTDRIDRLERDLRRSEKQLPALVLVGLLVLGLLGWGLWWPRGDLRVKRLALVDPAGNVVAELTADQAGPVLTLGRDDGPSLHLIASQTGAGIVIDDPAGPDISLLAGNQPYLFFGDASDPQSVLIGLDPSGRGPRLQLKYADRLWMATGRDPTPGGGLIAKDFSGTVLWRAP